MTSGGWMRLQEQNRAIAMLVSDTGTGAGYVPLWVFERAIESRWPVWLDVVGTAFLQSPNSLRSDLLRDKVSRRLLSGRYEPEAAGAADPHRTEALRRSLQRPVEVARTVLRGPGIDSLSRLEDYLLGACFAEGIDAGAFPCEPRFFSECSHVELPVLLVNTETDQGQVVHVRLWRVPVPGAAARDRLRLVPAPASSLLLRDDAFNRSLESVSTMLRSQLSACGASPRNDFALAWDLLPLEAGEDSRALEGVGGGSMGAALGLAALYLVRDLLPGSLCELLDVIDWRRAAVSARLLDDGFSLSTIDGLRAKFAAWERYHGAPRAIFTHRDQLRIGNIDQHGALDIFSLLDVVAHHAGDLTPAQARLLRRLQQPDATLNQDSERELLRAVADRKSVRSVRGYLLQRYAECALAQAAVLGKWDNKLDLRFVQLTLTAQESRLPNFLQVAPARSFSSLELMLKTMEYNPATRGQEGSVGDDVRGWQIKADPGAGKTTLLRHYEWVQASRALQSWSPDQRRRASDGSWVELCIAIPVATAPVPDANGQVDGNIFGTWLHDSWSDWYGNLDPLETLLGQYRVRFIIDGINEIQAANEDGRDRAIQSMVAWLDGLGSTIAPPIFSVRTLDATHSLAGKTWMHPVQEARIQRWRERDIRDYCETWGNPGIQLWQTLDGNTELLEMCSLPLNLAAQCEMVAAGMQPARHRAELFSALLWARLKREYKSLAGSRGLLSHWEKLQLASLETAMPNDWPLSAGNVKLLEGIMAQAFHLVPTRGRQLRVANMVEPPAAQDRDPWLHAVAGLGVAERTMDGFFNFLHQLLWQEYFAALRLVGMQQKDWPDFTPDNMPPLDQARASGQPLVHPTSPWEEAVKLAALLDRDPRRWTEHLLPRNPGLAGRAAAGCLDRLDTAALDELRRRLAEMAKDAAVDVRLRVEAAEALGSLGAARYVNGRQVGTAGKPCLIPADPDWIRIEGGIFTIGSDSGNENETPRSAVSVPSLDWARWPVTNEEFACFIADGGYDDSRWWPGPDAEAWLRGENAATDSRNMWQRIRLALQTDFDGEIARTFPWASKHYVDTFLRRLCDQSNADFQRWLDGQSAGGKFGAPAAWNSPDFNNPLQPVVGVSLYECCAYALWLTASTGREMRLPRETEFEVAATSPWRNGPTVAEADRRNTQESGLHRLAPVGVFPASDLANGLVDMLGNCCFWTVSRFLEKLEPGNLDRPPETHFDGHMKWTCRGGRCDGPLADARASFRGGLQPGERYRGLGFRLVQQP